MHAAAVIRKQAKLEGLKTQVKLEGLKTRACILRKTAFMRVDRSFYQTICCALSNSARCFASFKDMFYALFTLHAK